MRKFIFRIIDHKDNNTRANQIFEYLLITLILLNVIAIVLDSFEEFSNQYGNFLLIFEAVSVAIFSIEYILRIYTAKLKYPEKTEVGAIIKFITSTLGIIDLLAILPFYIPLIIPFDLRFLRMFRVTRLLSILKLNRYSKALSMIGNVLREKRSDLILTLVVTVIFLLISSTIMYYLENDAQPEKFPNILQSFWWSIVTLTTVGYGDVVPVTDLGKVLSGFLALLGVALVAIPTAIISSGYINEIKELQQEEKIQEEDDKFSHKKCPHCGKEIN
ncbi:ion transporter [Bacteroidota bacterium]